MTLAALSAACFAASATASTPGATDRTAAVQSVLDRVLGPGGSLVEITEERVASSGTVASTSYGAAVPAAIAASVTHLPGGVLRSSTQQNRVATTTTVVSTPPGTLLRETVAVVVDRKRLGTTRVATLRRLIGAAAGLAGARGDRLFVLVATFPAQPATATAPSGPRVADVAVPAMYAGGGLSAVLILVAMFRRRPPRRPTEDVA